MAKGLAFYNERSENLLIVEPNHVYKVLAELGAFVATLKMSAPFGAEI